MIKRVLLLVALFILIPLISDGKSLYVNNSGSPACSDATTYANNSASNPWCTIGRAAWGSTNKSAPNSSQAAQAGDIVIIMAGTYNATGSTGNGRYNVAYNPVNNGTSGNPITFKGEGLVTLQSTVSTGPVIGSDDRDYIIWDGFYIDEVNVNTRSDTGPVVVYSGNYVQLLNLEIKGIDPAWVDNHVGIRIDYSNHTTVRNCKIYEVAERGYGQNAAAMMMYASNDSIIENNEFHTCGVGVFVKGIPSGWTQDRNIIRKNLIYNMGHNGIRLLGSKDARVYQNIIRNSAAGVWIGFANPTGELIVNNTVVNNTHGIIPQLNEMVNIGFYNNIIVGGTHAVYCYSNQTPSTQDIAYNRNLYHGQSVNHARYNADGTSLNINFPTWQPTWIKDVNGVNSNPLFIDPTNHNYRLQSGSPARTLGRDILNLAGGGTSATIPAGAYITGNEVIGRNVSTSNAPAPPTGLGIQ